MILWIFIGALALVTLNWRRWQEGRGEAQFWVEQVIRFVIGFIWGFIGTYFALLDITPSAWFTWFAIPIIIVHAIDWGVSYYCEDEWTLSVTFEAVVTCGLIIACIILWAIVPGWVTKAKYDIASSYVTIVEDPVPETDTNKISIISEKTAKRIANPKIAELGNASKYTLGAYTKQLIDGRLVWVTPVEYENAIKAKGSTPGYFVVDAFDTSADVEVVENNKFYYMPSAIWGKDLKRHVRKEIPTKLLFSEMLQVDDEGNAFWVVPYGHYKYFRATRVIDGVAIVNPYNGGIECYAVEEVPEWVDAIVPGDIAENYANYYGQNKHGWWSMVFAPTDQFMLTVWEGDDAWSIVYDDDGVMWYVTDTTTMNADKSMVGYMMINARTMEMKYFPNVTGINGKGISENFIQIYKEKTGWSPVEPTLYNIYGTLTWFSTMVDENGAIQAYCFGDTKGNVVGETTMASALSSYKRMLATAGIDSNPTDKSEQKTIEGTVVRVLVSNGRTKILLDTKQVFVIDETVSVMAQFTKEGDQVKIVYLDTQETEIFAVEFVNETIE